MYLCCIFSAIYLSIWTSPLFPVRFSTELSKYIISLFLLLFLPFVKERDLYSIFTRNDCFYYCIYIPYANQSKLWFGDLLDLQVSARFWIHQTDKLWLSKPISWPASYSALPGYVEEVVKPLAARAATYLTQQQTFWGLAEVLSASGSAYKLHQKPVHPHFPMLG